MRNSDIRAWRQLTLRQKIGQTMIMLPNRKLELELGGGSLERYFERYPISGYFMGWKLFDGVPKEQWTDHVRKSVREYQAASALPLLFQEDYEYGVNLPGMTPMPMLMSVGAANSAELAYAYGKHNAKEAWSVGVRWVLNPIVDLNLNPMDPLICTRAISERPRTGGAPADPPDCRYPGKRRRRHRQDLSRRWRRPPRPAPLHHLQPALHARLVAHLRQGLPGGD